MKGYIQSIAFGGSGILRHEGEVIFVPFTAPQELVTCRIKQKKKNYSEGELVSIEEASSQRVPPLCPHFTVCGGCQLQHLNYEAQLEAKRQWVADALVRIGKIEGIDIPPVVPSPSPWHYRRHVTLHLQPTERGFKAGYYSYDNKSLVQVTQCPIFTPVDDPIFQQIHAIAASMEASSRNEGRVTLLKRFDAPPILLFNFKFMPKNATQVIQEQWLCHQDAGAILKAPNVRKSLGNVETKIGIEGLSITLSPESFVQNHPDQSLKMYQRLCEVITGPRVLDLYSGIGISSLLLGRKGLKVTGVESNKTAVRLARENGKANGQGELNFMEADVKTVLKDLLRDKPESVIVNPPREGIEEAVAQLLCSEKPNEIVYISCMPSTLARDLRILCGANYQIKMIQAFDMFPQTAHVETLVHLEKRAS